MTSAENKAVTLKTPSSGSMSEIRVAVEKLSHPKTVEKTLQVYQRALSAANCEGSPAVTGSDLSLTGDSSLHVAFYYDKVNVMTVFYCGEDRLDRPRIFTAAEAAQVGQRVADTGVYEESPVQVSISVIKFFGNRLKEYGGENVR